MFHPLNFANILQDERARVLREFNPCHTPSGPEGGQFCSKGGGGKLTITNRAPSVSVGGRFAGKVAGAVAKHEKARKAAFDAIGKHVPGFQPKRGMVAGSTSDPDTPYAAPIAGPAAPKKVRHKMEYPAEGKRLNPQHVATYRGMTINTLPSYTTPYYYVDAPGFGSFEHTPHIGTVKRQINAFKTTGETPTRARKRKGSERYQKRKARYG